MVVHDGLQQECATDAFCRAHGLVGAELAATARLPVGAVEAVLLSGVFDADYYLGRYPDIAQAGVNPLLHYLEAGRFERRQASEMFDPLRYLAINPEVGQSGIEPFLHYVLIGRAANLPRSRAESLCREVGLDYDTAAEGAGMSQTMFEALGLAFDAAAYLDATPQIATSGMAPFRHYVSVGHAAGLPRSRAERISQDHGLDFDSTAEIAGLSQPEFEAVLHAGMFDADFYLRSYPDVAKAGVNPYLHFMQYGRFENRKPVEGFAGAAYLEANPQVGFSGVEPYLHYVLVGQQENLPRSRAEIVCRQINVDMEGPGPKGLSVAGLMQKLKKSHEFDGIIKPVVREIRTIFARVIFRNPSAAEIFDAILNFYTENVTFCDRLDTVRRGNIRTHLGIRPLKLEMDVVNQCNLRCIMCHFSSPENYTKRKQEMKLNDFARIAHEIFPLCHHVSLSMSTEPLLHREFAEILRITRQYNIPFVHLYTNGMLMRPEVMTALVTQTVHQISVSVDGATRDTFERIRKGAKFDRLIANIQALNAMKEKYNSATPRIDFNFVLMRSNITELPALVHLANSLQVKAIYACHLVPLKIAAVGEQETLQSEKELCNRMLDEAREIARGYGISVVFPENFATEGSEREQLPGLAPRELHFPAALATTAQPPSCKFPWHFVGLEPGGDVIPCGWWYSEARMGNMLSEPFDAIWNNPRYRRLRAEHLRGHEHGRGRGPRHVCQTCPATGMGDVNNASGFSAR